MQREAGAYHLSHPRPSRTGRQAGRPAGGVVAAAAAAPVGGAATGGERPRGGGGRGDRRVCASGLIGPTVKTLACEFRVSDKPPAGMRQSARFLANRKQR